MESPPPLHSRCDFQRSHVTAALADAVACVKDSAKAVDSDSHFDYSHVVKSEMTYETAFGLMAMMLGSHEYRSVAAMTFPGLAVLEALRRVAMAEGRGWSSL